MIDNHNIKLDEEYPEDPNFIEPDLSVLNMDALIYGEFINKNIGYGVFAKIDIPANTIIGEYTGVLGYKKGEIHLKYFFSLIFLYSRCYDI